MGGVQAGEEGAVSSGLDAVKAELEAVGLSTFDCGRCRLGIRRPGKPMNTRYAPVWVTCLADRWYVVPWGGHVYPVCDRQAVIDVCRELIERFETGEWSGSVDSKLEELSLTRLNEEQDAEFGRRLYEAQRVSPPDVSLNDLCGLFERKGFKVRRVDDRSVHIATMADGESMPRKLWCTVYRNHWYVRTPGGRVYGCEDELIVELCFSTLKQAEPTIDHFSPEFVTGHTMFEVTGPLREEIERWAMFDGGT